MVPQDSWGARSENAVERRENRSPAPHSGCQDTTPSPPIGPSPVFELLILSCVLCVSVMALVWNEQFIFLQLEEEGCLIWVIKSLVRTPRGPLTAKSDPVWNRRHYSSHRMWSRLEVPNVLLSHLSSFKIQRGGIHLWLPSPRAGLLTVALGILSKAMLCCRGSVLWDVRCLAAVTPLPPVTTNENVSRHASCPLGGKIVPVKNTVLELPLHTRWQLVRWARLLRTRVFVFGFTSDSLKNPGQVNEALYNSVYSPASWRGWGGVGSAFSLLEE